MGSLYFGTYSGVDAKKSKVILIVVIIIKWGAFQDEIQFFLIEDPFKIKKMKIGEASRWRVCHQWGLPRLVFIQQCLKIFLFLQQNSVVCLSFQASFLPLYFLFSILIPCLLFVQFEKSSSSSGDIVSQCFQRKHNTLYSEGEGL